MADCQTTHPASNATPKFRLRDSEVTRRIRPRAFMAGLGVALGGTRYRGRLMGRIEQAQPDAKLRG
jgi:hypothetical protein